MKNLFVKKITAVSAAALMAAGMLAGCGSSSSTTTASTAAETTESSAAAESTAQTSEAASTEAASSEAASSEAASTAASAVSGEVTAAGSSALLPLAQAAAESFMKENPDCIVTVNGGGSGEGLKQVADGAVDIGDSDVFAEEKLDADAAAKLVDHEVCTITMAPVVNASNKVTDLSTDDLIGIFTGKITNWKDVGGDDMDIVLVTRPSSSGTRALFKTWALNGEEEASNEALETDDSGTLLQTVEQNEGAIGYVALSYLVNNDAVKTVSIDGVEPTLENTYNGTYKVWGYEHMYTNGEGSEQAQAFINYMMGDTFADQLESLGYGVSSKMSDDAVKAHEAQ
ncbi:MAG: phosphate ABC transporter substrate-binding protein [Lachnospiraceae bacterium]|jgi:phosphate transport system substrate-binding protein|nr:phosphate ABC transporter substrate-binding protein [Lachnospiraceae bacterium]MDY2944906.1 phosphate ABC transporter substrate-binding protein [Lachnospiraceae bacterium]